MHLNQLLEGKFMTLKRINREELIKLAQTFDVETKDYCLNDCIPTWDNKGLWKHYPPYALEVDGQLVSFTFLSTKQTGTSNIVYIQRVFTPQQFRKRGYFTELLCQIYSKFFNIGYNYIQLFHKPSVKLYKELNFMSVFQTLDGYEFCLQPIICNDLKFNNQLIASNKTCKFYTDDDMKYIESMKKIYA